ncbi:hypothetical protein [Streptomyces sp. NPDC048584]|uniref:hypothetical protein n=1 Tax=Streptomyces sp. NPDC048584 TaxID=3365573 RepID=UPI003722DA40
MTRIGIVTEAAIDVLAARLSQELRLEREEIYRIARAQAEDLRREGWRITVPVEAVPAAVRRIKAGRTP